jgi:hypothetical protein
MFPQLRALTQRIGLGRQVDWQSVALTRKDRTRTNVVILRNLDPSDPRVEGPAFRCVTLPAR